MILAPLKFFFLSYFLSYVPVSRRYTVREKWKRMAKNTADLRDEIIRGRSLLNTWNLYSFSFPFVLSLVLSSFLSTFLSACLSQAFRFSRIFGEFSLVPAAGNSESTIESIKIFLSVSFDLVGFSRSQLFYILVFRPLFFAFLLASPLTPLSSSLFLLSSSIHLRSRPKTRVLRIISGDPSTRVVA